MLGYTIEHSLEQLRTDTTPGELKAIGYGDFVLDSLGLGGNLLTAKTWPFPKWFRDNETQSFASFGLETPATEPLVIKPAKGHQWVMQVFPDTVNIDVVQSWSGEIMLLFLGDTVYVQAVHESSRANLGQWILCHMHQVFDLDLVEIAGQEYHRIAVDVPNVAVMFRYCKKS